MHKKPNQNGMILWKDSILFGTVSQNPTGKLLELFWFIFRIRSSVGPMNHFVSAMGVIMEYPVPVGHVKVFEVME
ncbi:hypothetical protein CsSME_00030317 [Camellia sinensis var. sinensis]